MLEQQNQLQELREGDRGVHLGQDLQLAPLLRERFARLVLLNTGAFPPPFFPWRIRVCRTPLLGRIVTLPLACPRGSGLGDS